MSNPPIIEYKVFGTARRGDIIANVIKSSHPLPRYSFEIRVASSREGDTRTFPRIPVRVDGQMQRATELYLQNFDAITQVLQDVRQIIEFDATNEAEAAINRRYDEDVRKAQRGQPVTRVTGKTARERAKKGKAVAA